MPELVLHALPPSHPCMTAEAALRLKGLAYERIDFTPGEHTAKMAELYGEGNTTVPGLTIDGEPVHGSRTILERLEALEPEPALYPEAIAGAVREAERWGDEELQDLGRRLPWGALHFRPEALGSFGGAGPLDPAGTDFAIRFARASWKYHRITAERLARTSPACPPSSTTSTRSPSRARSAASGRTPPTCRSARRCACCSPSATCCP